MDEAKRKLVLEWLARSEEDLGVARLLIIEEKRWLGAGAYHCQQAVEKALKAWLTWNEIVFSKTHDLETLLHLGREIEPELAAFAEHARNLTPMATGFRYPGENIALTQSEADKLFDQANAVYGYVRRWIGRVMARD